MNKSIGFTLLELLVAITVFGIMSAIAYRGLVEVALTDDAMKIEGERLQRLQFAFGLFERDARQSLPRGIRDEFGQSAPALIGTPTRFSFTRAGWSNPLSRPRASLERVDYQFDGGQMVRLGWPVLDRTQSSQPETLSLLQEIDLIRFAYLDQQQEWQNRWPPVNRVQEQDDLAWPKAISVTIQSTRYGTIERIFSLVDAPRPSRQGEVFNAGADDDG